MRTQLFNGVWLVALRPHLHGEICCFWETSQGKNGTSVNLGKKIFFCEWIFCQRGEKVCYFSNFFNTFGEFFFVKGTFSCESAICINKSVITLFPENVKFKKRDYHFRTEVVLVHYVPHPPSPPGWHRSPPRPRHSSRIGKDRKIDRKRGCVENSKGAFSKWRRHHTWHVVQECVERGGVDGDGGASEVKSVFFPPPGGRTCLPSAQSAHRKIQNIVATAVVALDQRNLSKKVFEKFTPPSCAMFWSVKARLLQVNYFHLQILLKIFKILHKGKDPFQIIIIIHAGFIDFKVLGKHLDPQTTNLLTKKVSDKMSTFSGFYLLK